jgi:hypothetical protein
MAYRAGTRRDIQRWNRKSIPASGLGNAIWSTQNNVSPTPAKILSPSTPKRCEANEVKNRSTIA